MSVFHTAVGHRAAGIPVYELHADNVDTRAYRESTEDDLADWIERAVLG